MLHVLIGILAILPAAILGWKFQALAALVRYDLKRPMYSRKGIIFSLIWFPWMLLVISWAAGVGAIRGFPDVKLMIPEAMLHAMIAAGLLGVVAELRRQGPKWVRSFRKRIDRFDEFLYTKLP